MTVLGIETATVTCSTAVVMNGSVVAEASIDRPRAHAEMLLAQVDEVLAQARLALEDIDGVAVSIGPGSFTGIRIGLSVAKGLAWSTAKQLAGVSTLKALARKVRDAGEPGEGGLLLTVIDSRRGEVYCRLDRMMRGVLVPEWEDRSLSVERLLHELPETPVVVAGESNQLREGFAGSGRIRILVGDNARCGAGPVALEGEEALRRGEALDMRTLEPRYLKDFEPKLKPADHMYKNLPRQS